MVKLIEEVASEVQLNDAWYHIQKHKDTSPGIDKLSIRQFEFSYKQNLREIKKELLTGKYSFSEVLEAKIPKKNSTKLRPINLFTIKDKIVQKSLQISLEKNRDKDTFFPEIRNSISVGFLTRQLKDEVVGIPKAIDLLKQYFDKGLIIMATVDIENFFGSITRKLLLEKIKKRLPDESLDYLIKQCVEPNILSYDRFENSYQGITSSGVAQGSILSPLFSNIYLSEFDKAIEEKGIKAIRYADDLAFFSPNQQIASQNLVDLSDMLQKTSKLKFYPKGSNKEPKYHKLHTEFGIYLGLRFEKKPKSWFIHPIVEKQNGLKDSVTKTLSYLRNESLNMRIEFLNSSIEGWFATYIKIGCDLKYLSAFHKIIKQQYVKQLEFLLKKRGLINKDLTSAQISFLGVLVKPQRRKFKV